MNKPTPQIGQIMNYQGKQYRIVAVHPAGTLDVCTLDESRYYRITGLSF